MMPASSRPSISRQSSRAEFMQAQALKSQLHGTAELRSKLLTGDYEATRQHNLLCVLLSSPIAEE